METLYLGIMLGMKLVQSLFVKRVSAGLSRPEDDLQYGFWSKMAAAAFALMILCLTGFTEPDLLTLLTAALMGLSLAAGTLCSLEAMRSGTVILCTMAGSAGLLLPIFAGALWWGESVSVWQWMGIAVLLVSGWLLVGSSRKIYTNFSGKTLLLLAGSLLFNGLTMVAQKLFSLYAEGGNAASFNFWGFLISALALAAAFCLRKAKRRGEGPFITPLPGKIYLYCGILAAAVLIISQLSTVAAKTVPSAVLFTVVNGGGTVLAALTAAVFFKEKLTLRSGSGVLLGVAALIVINAL